MIFSLSMVLSEGLNWGVALWYIVGIIFFVLLNALFVGSEFAITRLRLSQVEVNGDDKKNRLLKSILNDLDGYLSACQLGITLASLALGFLGEPFVAQLLFPLLSKIPEFSEATIHLISLIIAYSIFTFLHVVVGELLPKSLAIRRPLTTALWLSRPLFSFYFAFRWLLNFFNLASNFLLKKFFRIAPEDLGKEHYHTPEELAALLTNGEGTGDVTETEREILINALELNDLYVKDILTPRNKVVAIDIEQSFEDIRNLVAHSKHTRFPLVRGHLDDFLGFVHIKDLFGLILEENPDLLKVKRKLHSVPEMMPLDSLLQFFLQEKVHLALVVDEFGSPIGAVFLGDVIEELVGDIRDEFDSDKQPKLLKINEREFVINAEMTLNDLSDYIDEDIFKDTEATTIGGYVVEKFQRFPKAGEMVDIDNGYTVKIVRANERRIEKVRLVCPEKAIRDEESES